MRLFLEQVRSAPRSRSRRPRLRADVRRNRHTVGTSVTAGFQLNKIRPTHTSRRGHTKGPPPPPPPPAGRRIAPPPPRLGEAARPPQPPFCPTHPSRPRPP